MKIIRVILCFVTLSCFVLGICFSGLWQTEKSLDLNPVTYQGIITVWQIDSFEGGTGSRKQFLLNCGASFEKKHKGVLIMVTTHTINSAEENFKNGVYPDLISYGVGLDVQNVSQIKTEKPLSVACLGDKEYGAVWCRGVYCLIENVNYKGKDNFSVTVSKGNYTNPLVALTEVEKGYVVNKVLTPLDAYVNFVSGNTRYLLGTQRDVVRLNNRGFEYELQALNGFSDLNQFISVVSENEQKRFYAEQFVNYLLSDEIQKTLNSIAMFSALHTISYDEENLQKLSNAKIDNGVSMFAKKESISNLNSLSEEYLKTGDKEVKIKIKNLLS